jgi:hypothetical protein
MQDTQCRDDEVLGLRNQWNNPNESIGEQSSLMDYVRLINLQLVRMVNRSMLNNCLPIPNEVVCHVKPGATPAEWFSIMSDAGQRLAWIEDGITIGKEFHSKKSKMNGAVANAAADPKDAAEPNDTM